MASEHMMNFFALAASTRQASVNKRLIHCCAESITQQGGRAKVGDFAFYDAPFYHEDAYRAHGLPEGAARLADDIHEADAVIIAVPEYNWSYPGSLKTLVDWVSCLRPSPFQKKPVLLVSASPSLQGGVKGLTHFSLCMVSLGAYVYPRLFTVSDAVAVFASGTIQPEMIARELEETIAAFMDYSRRLKA